MNQLTIDLDILRHNLETVDGWMRQHGARWTLVTKALCGQMEVIEFLHGLGVKSLADSRLENLSAIRDGLGDFEAWYLRPPEITSAAEIVAQADVSLNTEIRIIRKLNEEALRQGKKHSIVVMIELGDLREGILPGNLIEFYQEVLELAAVDVIGIGANLGCLSGAVPTVDQFTQLVLYRELLELKFDRKLPVISAGSSAVLPLLLEGGLPRAINHFRNGEAILLGSDLVNGGILPGLRDDAFRLEAEVVEVKEKSLVSSATGVSTPFEGVETEEPAPGERGYRALLSIGQLDTDIGGLTPVDPNVQIAGASSDLTVVNLLEGPQGIEVGGTLAFRPSYGALVRLMGNPYLRKVTSTGRGPVAAGDPPGEAGLEREIEAILRPGPDELEGGQEPPSPSAPPQAAAGPQASDAHRPAGDPEKTECTR